MIMLIRWIFFTLIIGTIWVMVYGELPQGAGWVILLVLSALGALFLNLTLPKSRKPRELP